MTLKHAFIGVMTAGLLAFACDVDRSSSDDPAGYYFTGAVYDGLEGKALTKDYTITLHDASSPADGLKGTVDKAGKFSLGPLKPGSDYVITIDAEGFRPFYAAEPMKTALPNSADQTITQYYEAYVFPLELESPPVTLEFYGQDSLNTRPSGSVRFAPAMEGTSALNLTSQTSSVGSQLWSNDADRKAGTRIVKLTDGVLELPKGELVYGVAYTGTVYDVEGHGYKSFNFTAGQTGHQTIVLDNLADEALQLLSSTLDTGVWSKTGEVTFTFNYPIEFSPASPDYFASEVIDDGITIMDDEDADGDNVFNVLIGDSTTTTAVDNPNKQERGTKIEIDGYTLTLSWPNYNKASSYEPNMFDLDDLQAVTYNVTGISIRRVGATDIEAKTLSSLVGGGAVTVDLVEPWVP